MIVEPVAENATMKGVPASAVDRIQTAIAAIDDTLEKVLQELGWMDVQVLALPRFEVRLPSRTPTGGDWAMEYVGTTVHLTHHWDTRKDRDGDDHRLYAQALGRHECDCVVGRIRKVRGRRYEYLGEYRFLGHRGDIAYIAPAQHDVATERAQELYDAIYGEAND